MHLNYIDTSAQNYEYVGWNDTITSGWGTTSSGGFLSTILQYVKVPPVSKETCQDALTSYTSQLYEYNQYDYNEYEVTNPFDEDSMICAGKIIIKISLFC